MKFNEWKTLAMCKLLTLYDKFKDNRQIAADLNFLIIKLKELRARDISSFLFYVHQVRDSRGIDELKEIIPDIGELKKMLEESEE